MRRLSLVCLALLLTGSGLSCARKASEAPPTDHQVEHALQPTGRVEVGQGDTTFVELRRFEQHGIRTAEGGCRWQSEGDNIPAGLPKGVTVETHVVAVRDRPCTYLVALGYRQQALPLDTVGTAGVELTTTLDSAALRAHARLSRP